MRTLGIDCGGSGIKGSVLDAEGGLLAERVRIKTPYPLPPERFIGVLLEIAAQLPEFDRVTVGLPGMIRHGVVIVTPHYPNLHGPYTRKDPELDAAWRHWDATAALEEAFGKPVRVLNDAEVQGAAVIQRTGLEVVFTLGTGLGCAVYDDGRLAPHLELSHAPVRKDFTYDTWMGKAQLKRLGPRKWSRRILATVDGMRPVFRWDHLYVGGGNAKHLMVDLGNDVTIVPNVAGILGGVRVWDLDMAR
ncbi:MAG TPA: ROK family protein [Actinomycetota bacterium]|jgi:polyphosphate glucokinase|nr:ROK family protein [Actinomycetota bacterium]HNL51980.1 ROK family protein [Actinomycetota bacterium]HNO16257.1 ROK family protein [Actinomycetota bacterium]HUM87337.1 ROK family protein [Actinomycetota bacterium]